MKIADDGQQCKGNETRLIGALSIASIIVYINLYLVQGILPLIAATFDVKASHATLLFSVTVFSLALALLFFAVLSDRIGRKKPLLISLYLLVGSDVVMLFMHQFTLMVVLRLIQGVLLAAVPAIAMAFFKDELGQGALLKAGAVYIAANSFGGVAGRLLGGSLSHYLPWQSVILVILVISLMGVLLVHYLLAGFKTATVRVDQTDDAIESARSERGTDFKGFMQHLKDPTLCKLFLIGGLSFLVMVNLASFIQLHLMAPPWHWGDFQVTLIFLCYLSGVVASYFSNHWVKLIGRTRTFALAWLLMLLGSLITLINTPATIFSGFLLLAFGFFFMHSRCNAWVIQNATSHRAKATALYLCSYYIGAAIGGPFLMPFWQHWGWSGVVAGSAIVLMLLAVVMFTLFHTDRGIDHTPLRV